MEYSDENGVPERRAKSLIFVNDGCIVQISKKVRA
jgi:hypothetical protein